MHRPLFFLRYRRFWLATLEAAIRKCPVITTPTGAIEDLLGNYPIYVNSENQTSVDQGF